ncbi:MAG TPA: ABC transporter substrate-binding protein [Ilumatobacteraceae bacterium]|nr:ABC transporter substrate-binding protein [Ilumatobacteraceae bacterium]
MKARKSLALLSVASIALLAACGSDDDSGDATSDTAAPDSTEAEGGETTDGEGGAGVCPQKLTIQTDWFPELEHGGTYQLIGPDGVADKDTVSYSGPVQEQYRVGGLEELQINTVRFDKANSAILLDGEADMAYINMSDVIKDSAAVDMVAIAKTLDKDPQMIMWDPEQNPIESPEDIAASGAQVLHFPGVAYIDYMIGQGYMTEDQSNPSYDGSDAAWVADGGNFFQQGFATNEVFKYENEIEWKDGAPAPVDFYTVADLGFDNYPAAITMMRDKAEELSDCLDLLVPVMQQAWVDYLNDPKPITDAMIDINVAHDGFWGLSEGLNEAGLELVESGEFALNSPDGTYCSFDEERVQGLYDILAPIYEEQGTEIADSIDGIFTNEYCADAPGR